LLSRAAASVASRLPVEVILAPPHPLLGLVASQVEIEVFSQSVSENRIGPSTGAVLPEAVSAAGGRGTLLNHSEAPIGRARVAELLPRLRELNLKVCLCAKTAEEAQDLSTLGPDFIAVEPPELIGSGVAVSNARPELLSDTVLGARKAGYAGRILCGAGIVEGRDVERAVELGVEGVLVASSVVKAKDWTSKIGELAEALA